jgi:hypothetical protein
LTRTIISEDVDDDETEPPQTPQHVLDLSDQHTDRPDIAICLASEALATTNRIRNIPDEDEAIELPTMDQESTSIEEIATESELIDGKQLNTNALFDIRKRHDAHDAKSALRTIVRIPESLSEFVDPQIKPNIASRLASSIAREIDTGATEPRSRERRWISTRTRLRRLTTIDAIHVANIRAVGLRTKQWGIGIYRGKLALMKILAMYQKVDKRHADVDMVMNVDALSYLSIQVRIQPTLVNCKHLGPPHWFAIIEFCKYRILQLANWNCRIRCN